MDLLKRIVLIGTMSLPVLGICDFQIVRDGKPEAVIVLSEQATRSAQLGAYELQHHVRLMTGTELPIVHGKAPDARNVIRIGGENRGLTGDSNRIEFKGNMLLLTGSDSPDCGKVDYRNPATFPKVEYECKGSLFAVYDFLELYCGVRFYGMDETGTTYPVTKNLFVRERNRTFSPPLDAFRYVYDDDRNISKFKVSPRDRALWQLRWRMSILFGQTNHNQYSIFFAHWDKAKNPNLAKAFKGKRKEFFAQGFEGKNHGADPILRTNYPKDKDLPPQLCYSCKDTVEYYANEVLTYFKGGNVPGGWKNFGGNIPADRTLVPRFEGKPYYYPIQGGDTGGHCLCANCRKRFPDDNRDNVSNNKFRFIADVAREAAKTEPAAGVSTLAYIQTLRYPEKVNLPENVSVQLCLTVYSWWHPVSRQKQMDAYREWIVKEAEKRPLTLWTYLFSTYWDSRFHFGKYKPFPGLYPWKTGELFRMFTRDGIRGWFTEVEMQYNHLEAYVAARICYDPSLDPDRIIDEYFINYYGAAGAAMKEFYREIEKAYWNPANCPPQWLKNKNVVTGPKGPKHPYWGTGLHSPDVNWTLGTPERMKKLNGLIGQAKKLVHAPNEKLRLQRIIDGIWTNTLEGEREYQLLKIRRNAPPRRLVPAKVEDVNGELAKIDWSKAARTETWGDSYGRAREKSSCYVEAAADSKYLYLRFHDANAPKTGENIWKENIEFFFHAGGGYPVCHLAVAPDGTLMQYRHEFVNDSPKISPYDFELKLENRAAEDSWTVLMALPWSKLPLENSRMSLNFMRTSPLGNTVWNPIYTSGYISGIDSFGVLVLYPQIIQEDQFHYHRKGVNSTLADDPAASNGKAAAMNANNGWSVQYRFPKDFVPGKYQVSAALRTDAPAEDGLQSTIGIYNEKLRKVTASKVIPAKESSGGEYKLFDLGTWDLGPDGYLYIGGLNRKFPGNKIFVDYIRLNPANGTADGKE